MQVINNTEFETLVKDWSELVDNRFAVINGVHVDLTDYHTDNDSFSIISIHNATDCSNISNASGEYLSDETLIKRVCFTNEAQAAETFFVELIKKLLVGEEV